MNHEENIFNQICLDIWSHIMKGKAAPSFIRSDLGQMAIKDISQYLGLNEIRAESKLNSIFDKIDTMAFIIDREKRLSHPDVQKAMAEITSAFGVYNSTKLGRQVAEAIARDLKITASVREPLMRTPDYSARRRISLARIRRIHRRRN